MKPKHVLAIALLFQSIAASAAGPTGLANLKIGMTREEVEALQPTEPVSLRGPLKPYVYQYDTPKVGEDKFNVLLATPLSTRPLEAVLTFGSGRLLSLRVRFDTALNTLEQTRNLIAEKYGPGKVTDDRKEDQCIYRTAASFKISSGTVKTTWVEPVSSTDRIETTLTDVSIDVCPAENTLRYRSPPTRVRALEIRKVDQESEAKPKNIF